MKEELLEKLGEVLKEESESNDNLPTIRLKNADNMRTIKNILKLLEDKKSIVEASSETLRSYDDALAKCLDIGAKADDEFMYDFTTNYLNTILSLVANLCVVKDFAKNKDNLAFIKSKVRECLIYIDRL